MLVVMKDMIFGLTGCPFFKATFQDVLASATESLQLIVYGPAGKPQIIPRVTICSWKYLALDITSTWKGWNIEFRNVVCIEYIKE